MMGIGAVGSYPISQAYAYAMQKRGAVPQSQPSVPVEPVAPVKPAAKTEPQQEAPKLTPLSFAREGVDPVEMAVRNRIQYVEPSAEGQKQAEQASVLPGAKEKPAEVALPGAKKEAAELPAMPGAKQEAEKAAALPGEAGEAKSPQEVMEEGECQTCKNRKYQDGSNDPGVSFKTPAHIAPEQAAAKVRGHEMEHVTREQAAAQREGRKVVQQSVTMHTAICPECGDVYVSGGTTRTVTRADNRAELFQQPQPEKSLSPVFEAVA